MPMKPLRRTLKKPKRSRKLFQETSEAPMRTLSSALPCSNKWKRATTFKNWTMLPTVTCLTAWRKTWSAWPWQLTTSLKASGPKQISKLRSHANWWMPKSRSSEHSIVLMASCMSSSTNRRKDKNVSPACSWASATRNKPFRNAYKELLASRKLQNLPAMKTETRTKLKKRQDGKCKRSGPSFSKRRWSVRCSSMLALSTPFKR